MNSEVSTEIFLKSIRKAVAYVAIGIFFCGAVRCQLKKAEADSISTSHFDFWIAPDTSLINRHPDSLLINYGRKLIARTSYYLGPQGAVSKISNGMNCQNCHLEVGTKVFGNNYGAVASTYPKFRPRSGSVETIEKRINDCLQRSLNSTVALDTNSREMMAMVSYIKWVGERVPKGETPKGSGLVKLSFLSRAADPEKGKLLYEEKCTTCHGKSGAGIKKESGEYVYPPLWGENSYNTGAGLFRLSRFAGYIKANMPLGASYNAPMLSDEESWDIAAYVNSQARPEKKFSEDWPDISKKPFDHPFGPYADAFDEKQHKFGPFLPIVEKIN